MMFPSLSFEYEQMENRLTALFISTISHIPSSIVLNEILGISHPKNEVNILHFNLQESERESVPDASIKGKDLVIYIESKLTSSMSTNQIEKHVRQGVKHSKNFFLICMTDGLTEPSEIQTARRTLKKEGISPNIIWHNWKRMYEIFQQLISKSDLDIKKVYILKNFNHALEILDLVGYLKVTSEEITNTQQFFEYYTSLYSKLEKLGEEVEKQLKNAGIHIISKVRKSDDSIYWNFTKNNWRKISNEWHEGTALFFGFVLDDSVIAYGVHINGKIIYRDDVNYKTFFNKIQFNDFSYKVSKKSKQDLYSHVELMDVILNTKENEDVQEIILTYTEPMTTLLEISEVEHIANVLISYAKQIDHNNLYSPT